MKSIPANQKRVVRDWSNSHSGSSVLLSGGLIFPCNLKKKSRGVPLAFASHLLSPTMSDSEIGGEPAIKPVESSSEDKLPNGFHKGITKTEALEPIEKERKRCELIQ